jgi:MFS family permease
MSLATAGPCDHGLAGAAPHKNAARHPKGTLAATILGSSLAFIDGSVVNVGLPAIEHDLASSGASGASIGWLINAYLVPLGALVLLGGVAGDRYGRKRMFLAGLALFTAAVAGLRARARIRLAARGARRRKASARRCWCRPAWPCSAPPSTAKRAGAPSAPWAAAGAITGALGPLVGGWLVDAIGWRSIFLVNLPIAAVARGSPGARSTRSRADDPPPLDGAGALLATAGLGLATFGLTVLAARGGAGAGSFDAALAALAAASPRWSPSSSSRRVSARAR